MGSKTTTDESDEFNYGKNKSEGVNLTTERFPQENKIKTSYLTQKKLLATIQKISSLVWAQNFNVSSD